MRVPFAVLCVLAHARASNSTERLCEGEVLDSLEKFEACAWEVTVGNDSVVTRVKDDPVLAWTLSGVALRVAYHFIERTNAPELAEADGADDDGGGPTLSAATSADCSATSADANWTLAFACVWGRGDDAEAPSPHASPFTILERCTTRTGRSSAAAGSRSSRRT